MTTGHAEALMPMISRVMGAAGLAFGEIDRIAVTFGPGTFTGTRVGVAAARALALAHRVPVVGFSSLRVLGVQALTRIPEGNRALDAVMVARDARRDECYIEVIGGDGISRTSPLLLTPAAAATLCPGYRLFAFGTAATAVADAGRRVGRDIVADAGVPVPPEHAEPNIAVLLDAAGNAPPSDTPIRPLYLRAPDAKPQDGKSVPRATASPDGEGPVRPPTAGGDP